MDSVQDFVDMTADAHVTLTHWWLLISRVVGFIHLGFFFLVECQSDSLLVFTRALWTLIGRAYFFFYIIIVHRSNKRLIL